MSDSSPYFPFRYRASRPFAKAVTSEFEEQARAGKLAPSSAQEILSRHIITQYAAEGVSARQLVGTTRVVTEMMTGLALGEWQQNGSIIYDLAPELVSAFLHSDLGQISLDNVTFPHDRAYISFGPQPTMSLGPDIVADGAFILRASIGLRVILTGRYTGTAPPWSERARECYDLRILAEHHSKPINEAIEGALDDDIRDLERARETMLRNDPNADLSPANALLEAHRENRAAFAEALKVVVNGLCFITSYRDDVKLRWPSGAPEKLAAQAESTRSSKEVRRAESKLLSLGFQRVQYVGSKFEASAGVSDHRNIKAHWRRGHWRSQAHGPQFSLHKLIWLAPTRVMGEVAEGEETIVRVRADETLR
ncbi:hypothetical protein F6X40_09645 [Paraburkholderia sp. UCT31]|uniref:hypothetical protein n=1 Tax=Paraburkholderia sp. UCT31 TaxID=2615209 RepID=UPI001655CE47|nr:hypothetical protein [Paraburkholderia sp. UCT31]MBC8737071.1 hypothetical protein [Paraburkholderia sp. UCT31]